MWPKDLGSFTLIYCRRWLSMVECCASTEWLWICPLIYWFEHPKRVESCHPKKNDNSWFGCALWIKVIEHYLYRDIPKQTGGKLSLLKIYLGLSQSTFSNSRFRVITRHRYIPRLLVYLQMPVIAETGWSWETGTQCRSPTLGGSCPTTWTITSAS